MNENLSIVFPNRVLLQYRKIYWVLNAIQMAYYSICKMKLNNVHQLNLAQQLKELWLRYSGNY